MGGWQEKIPWDSKKRRNEALDCFVYALAALRISISRSAAGSQQRCWRAHAGRVIVQQPTRKHWQITPVPYPERMNDVRQEELAAARAALHDLMTGKRVATVARKLIDGEWSLRPLPCLT